MGAVTDRLLSASPQVIEEPRPPLVPPPEGGPLRSAVPPALPAPNGAQPVSGAAQSPLPPLPTVTPRTNSSVRPLAAPGADFLDAQGQPTRPPETPSESRITDRLLGGSPFAPPLPENTATRPEFDIPEITQIEIPNLGGQETFNLAAGLLFAMDEQQQIDIISNNLPGTEFNRDRNGNLFVRIPGTDTAAYINRPGPSPQDFTQIGAMIGPAVKVGQAGAALGQMFLSRFAGPTAGRVVGTATGEAALSRMTDAGLRAVGSEQPLSTQRALTAGVFGATGEVLVPPVARLLGSAQRGGTRIFSGTDDTVTLTEEARQIIREAGVDPDTLSQDFIRRLNIEAETAATPAQAQRVAEAETLPTPVPLTRGDATRLPSDQMFEDIGVKGGFGRTVQSILQGTRDAQQTALRASAEQIQGGLSGGQSQVLQRGDGGAIASQAINEVRDAAQRVVNSAYDSARASGAASLPAQAAGDLATNLEKAAADRIEFAPRAQSVLADFRALGPAPDVPVGPVTVRGRPIEVRPSRESVRDIADANATRGIVLGDETVNINSLEGGVRLSDPTEAARVDRLARQMDAEDGFIERIVVDESGTVVEGQHRLEAMRRLGVENVPITRIGDLRDGFNFDDMRQAVRDALPDLPGQQIDQIADRAIEAIREEGSAAAALAGQELPAQFQPGFEAALRATRRTAATAVDGVSVEDLFNWRRRVTTLAQEATEPTDASALAAIRDTFDAQIVDIVEQGLLQGEEATVKLWLDAIAARREFGAIFQAVNKDAPQYLTDLLTQRIPGQGRVLRFEPDQAANAMFGMTNTGFVNNPQLARQLTHLKRTLLNEGREDAWNALREEAFARFVGQAEGPFIGSTNTRSFSGANFAKALDQANERNLPLMMALFTKEERALMDQLQRTALTVTTRTAGGANTSNTAIAQSQIFQSTLGKLFGSVFGPVFRSAADTVPLASLPAIVRAQRATTGGLPRALGLPPGVGGGIGATIGPPATEEIQRRF